MTTDTADVDVVTALVEIVRAQADRIDALAARVERSDRAHVEQTVTHVGSFGAEKFWRRSPALLAITTEQQGRPEPLN